LAVGRLGAWRNAYRERGGGSRHWTPDPLCDRCYLPSTPISSPATFMRTRHDQNVALSSGRTLSYHTPLPRVDNAMVDSQRSVANSIPASGPPPCTHSPPLRR